MSRRTLIISAIVVVAVGIVALSSLYTVHQTEQVIVLQFGDPRTVVTEPGLKVKIPFIQNVIRIDKRILAFDGADEEIIALDQKRLVVDSYTRFRIIDPLLYFQTVGNESVARARLGTLVSSNLREILGSVPLSSVLTAEREALMGQIAQAVDRDAAKLGLSVVDVRIKRADLPEANSQAIYERMKAERDREARQFRAEGAGESRRIRSQAERERTVIIAEAEKEAQILRGDGDGARNRVFAEAFGRDPEFFSFYRSMLAYETAFGGEDTTMVLSPNSEFFRFFGTITESLITR
jgi:membrane protease subunit HflC